MQRSLVALLRILVHVAGKPALNGTLTSQSLYISQWKREKNLKKGNNDSITSVEMHKKNFKKKDDNDSNTSVGGKAQKELITDHNDSNTSVTGNV